MKNLFILLLLLIINKLSIAQTVDYAKIILPDNADSLTISEKLVQLAWKNYPSNEVALLNLELAKRNVTVTKLEWADNLSGSFNVNEFTVKNRILGNSNATNGNIGNAYYPLYNANLRIPLSTFVTLPAKVKRDKVNVRIAEAQINGQKMAVRAEILKRYQTYLTSIEVLKLRVKASEEAHLIHLLVTKKFKKGEAILEEYNKSFLTYNNAQEGKVLSESQVYLAKTAIEEMIGVKLEEVTGSRYENQKVDKKGDTTITASGLKYVILEPGFGEKPKSGQTVKVFYTGKFLNGKEFENNLKDDPFRFTIGVQQVIAGWDEGLPLMKEGEKGLLILPARLAYGRQGIKDPSNDGAYLVPPDTPVMYEIELVDVK